MKPGRISERRVEKLRPDHQIEGFDCGTENLNRYLQRYAWQKQQAGAAQTYVGLDGDAVIGYHTLAVGQVFHEEVPERLTKGPARHRVPIVLLARPAVGHRWQGQGVGIVFRVNSQGAYALHHILYNTAPFATRPNRRSFIAFSRSERTRASATFSASWGASPSRRGKGLSTRHGSLTAGSASYCKFPQRWGSPKAAITASAAWTWEPKRPSTLRPPAAKPALSLHHHHRGLRQVVHLLRGSLYARPGEQPDLQKRAQGGWWPQCPTAPTLKNVLLVAATATSPYRDLLLFIEFGFH